MLKLYDIGNFLNFLEKIQSPIFTKQSNEMFAVFSLFDYVIIYPFFRESYYMSRNIYRKVTCSVKQIAKVTYNYF